MVFQSKLLVGFFDVVQGSILSHAKDFVVVLLLLRVVLLEERFLLLAEDPLLFKEPIKHFEGIVNRVVRSSHDVVLMPPSRIGEVDVGLGDIIELLLCLYAIIGILVGMVLRGQTLIGCIDLGSGGGGLDPKGFVEVFLVRSGHYIYYGVYPERSGFIGMIDLETRRYLNDLSLRYRIPTDCNYSSAPHWWNILPQCQSAYSYFANLAHCISSEVRLEEDWNSIERSITTSYNPSDIRIPIQVLH